MQVRNEVCLEWELEPIYETCRDGADGFLYVSVSATEFMG